MNDRVSARLSSRSYGTRCTSERSVHRGTSESAAVTGPPKRYGFSGILRNREMSGRKTPAKQKRNEKECSRHRPGSGDRACPFAISRACEEFQGAHYEDFGVEHASQEAYAQALIEGPPLGALLPDGGKLARGSSSDTRYPCIHLSCRWGVMQVG